MSIWRRVIFGLVLIVVAIVGAVTLWWKWAPLHKHAYVARDERLLAALPPMPGSRELSRSVESVDDGSCDGQILCMSPTRIVGYRLYAEYSLPSAAEARDVLRWYRRHLVGWHRAHPVDAPLDSYTRGRDEVMVDVQQAGRVAITVDAKP